MRISDWSSDVCSSDLRDISVIAKRKAETEGKGYQQPEPGEPAVEARVRLAVTVADPPRDEIAEHEPRRHRAAEPEAGFRLVHAVDAAKEGGAPQDEGEARDRHHREQEGDPAQRYIGGDRKSTRLKSRH